MKRSLLAPLVLAAAALTACGGPPAVGTVTSHSFVAPSVTESGFWMSTGTNGSGMWVPYEQQNPAEWVLSVRLDSDPSKVVTVDVPQQQWNTVHDGEHFDQTTGRR
jgi:hypothetical protein